MEYVDGLLEKVRVNILKRIHELKGEQQENPKKIPDKIFVQCLGKLEEKLNKIDRARGILKEAWGTIK